MRQEADREGLYLLGLLGQRIGQPHDERELGDLRGLNVNRAQGEPSRRTSARMAETDHARHEQKAHRREQRVGQLVEAVVVDAANAKKRYETGGRVRRLTLQIKLRVVMLDGR